MRRARRKEINKLDHVVTNNLNNYNNQNNEAIDNEPTLDNITFSLFGGTSYPLRVVTASLRGGKKHGETIFAGTTCLWNRGATNSMIKRQHTNHYEQKVRSNRVYYITATGVYCTTHDVKVTFCMPELSGSKIINHCFRVDNY